MFHHDQAPFEADRNFSTSIKSHPPLPSSPPQLQLSKVLCLCGDYVKSVMERTSSPGFILWNFSCLNKKKKKKPRSRGCWYGGSLQRCSASFLYNSECKASVFQTHITSSEVQALIKVSEASFLRHVLFVSQNAVMTFWDTRSLNRFGSDAGKVNKHVHISMSGVREPTCYCLTAASTLPSRQLYG